MARIIPKDKPLLKDVSGTRERGVLKIVSSKTITTNTTESIPIPEGAVPKTLILISHSVNPSTGGLQVDMTPYLDSIPVVDGGKLYKLTLTNTQSGTFQIPEWTDRLSLTMTLVDGATSATYSIYLFVTSE